MKHATPTSAIPLNLLTPSSQVNLCFTALVSRSSPYRPACFHALESLSPRLAAIPPYVCCRLSPAASTQLQWGEAKSLWHYNGEPFASSGVRKAMTTAPVVPPVPSQAELFPVNPLPFAAIDALILDWLKGRPD